MVTIKEIAEIANVSVSTVYNVLNGAKYVSEEITQRVSLVVEKTGYKPLRKSKLAKVKHKHVCIIVSRKYANGYRLSVELFDDCIITIVKTSDNITQKWVNNLQKKHSFDYVLIHNSVDFINDSSNAIFNNLVFFNSDIPLNTGNYIYVKIDYANCILKAVEYLQLASHKKVAVIMSAYNQYTEYEIKYCVLEYFHNYNIEIPEKFIFEINSDIEKEISNNILNFSALIIIGSQAKEYYSHIESTSENDAINNISKIYIHDELIDYKNKNESYLNFDFSQIKDKIQRGKNLEYVVLKPNFKLNPGNSVEFIARDSWGEEAKSTANLSLLNRDILKLRDSHIKIAVCMENMSALYFSMLLQSIYETCSWLNMEIEEIFDAKGDINNFKYQLERAAQLNVFAVISCTNWHYELENLYLKLMKNSIKLALGGQPPKFITNENYICAVTTNFFQKGAMTARLISKGIGNENNCKIAVLPAYFSKHTLPEETKSLLSMLEFGYPNIEVVIANDSIDDKNAVLIAKELLEKHPGLKGICVHNYKAAIEINNYFKANNIKNVFLLTAQLNRYFEANLLDNVDALSSAIIGFTTSQPNKIGRALTLSVACKALNKNIDNYFSIMPKSVYSKTLQNNRQNITEIVLNSI